MPVHGFGRLHRDDGGATPGDLPQTEAMQAPLNQQAYGYYQNMSTEQLQETALRLKGSPQGQMAQRVLQMKRMSGTPDSATPTSSTATAPSNTAPNLSGPPQSFALGGELSPSGGVDFTERGISGGFLNTAGPGRTDNLNISPNSNSYVLPADVVAGLGEGNSLAGAKALDAALHTGPHGIPQESSGHRNTIPSPPRPSGGFARMPETYASSGGRSVRATSEQPRARRGGAALFAQGGAERVPIVAAGGEYVVSPEQVAAIGGGSIKRGHDILDAFVLHIRDRTIKEMRKLKGPVKS